MFCEIGRLSMAARYFKVRFLLSCVIKFFFSLRWSFIVIFYLQCYFGLYSFISVTCCNNLMPSKIWEIDFGVLLGSMFILNTLLGSFWRWFNIKQKRHWVNIEHLFPAQEIAELYESEQNIEQAIVYFEKSADFFQNEEVTTSANQCKQKVAQFAAQLEQ